MDFNDMKKIWNAQNQQALYAIDEQVLRDNVIKQKDRASYIANKTEVYMIGSLIIASSIIWAATIYTGQIQMLPLTLSGFMVVMATLLYKKRSKRLLWQNTFDRSILGDLDEAIANAEYQLNFSKWSRNLFLLVATLTVVDVFSLEAWWKSTLVISFFIVVYFLAKWEYRIFYLSQRNNLLEMREKLNKL